MHRKLMIPVIITIGTVVGSWSGLAGASQPTHLDGSRTSPCSAGGQPPLVDVTGTYKLMQQGTLVWGEWSFVANNGKNVHFSVRYQVGGATDDEYIGTSVVVNDVVGKDWLYVSGTASFSLGGYFSSYAGTATDICQVLGVD